VHGVRGHDDGLAPEVQPMAAGSPLRPRHLHHGREPSRGAEAPGAHPGIGYRELRALRAPRRCRVGGPEDVGRAQRHSAREMHHHGRLHARLLWESCGGLAGKPRSAGGEHARQRAADGWLPHGVPGGVLRRRGRQAEGGGAKEVSL